MRADYKGIWHVLLENRESLSLGRSTFSVIDIDFFVIKWLVRVSFEWVLMKGNLRHLYWFRACHVSIVSGKGRVSAMVVRKQTLGQISTVS